MWALHGSGWRWRRPPCRLLPAKMAVSRDDCVSRGEGDQFRGQKAWFEGMNLQPACTFRSLCRHRGYECHADCKRCAQQFSTHQLYRDFTLWLVWRPRATGRRVGRCPSRDDVTRQWQDTGRFTHGEHPFNRQTHVLHASLHTRCCPQGRPSPPYVRNQFVR